ncbi:MAG: sigma-70 family RNA polymerase sigma factor [Daejeonella sp.]|uniref:RNA polymerase sigma factor n=1 Tax=Daejeonella sp. TaxID=2805397 RepID=UPI003C7504F5
MMKVTEEELIKGMREGDQTFISILYDNYSATLNGVIFKMVHNEEFAEDLLQETFVKIWQSFSQYNESKGRLFTWMINITRFHVLDQMKRRSYRNYLRNESISSLSTTLDDQYHSSNNPDTIGVKEMAGNLQPKYKSLIDLIYFKGYTHSEAAEDLNIPLGTVKTRLRAAMCELRLLFNERPLRQSLSKISSLSSSKKAANEYRTRMQNIYEKLFTDKSLIIPQYHYYFFEHQISKHQI